MRVLSTIPANLSISDERFFIKKKKNQLHKCIMANTSAIRQQAAHTTYQLSSPSCLTRAIQKSLTLHEKCCRMFWEKSWENGPLAERWPDRKSKRTRQKKQERRWERGLKWQPWDSGLGDWKTREEMGKGTQMTALRLRTWGQKNKTGDRKGDSNDSPEIADLGTEKQDRR